MQPIMQARREALRRYVEDHGGPTSVAKALGYSNGSFLSQLIGPNPIRPFTEKVARKIEEKLGLAPGYLDRAYDVQEIRAQYLVPSMSCVEAVAGAVQQAQIQASPKQYAAMVALASKHITGDGRPDPEVLALMVSLLK